MVVFGLLGAALLKRRDNHKHEQTMGAETNKAALEMAKQSDNAALELAKLEAQLRKEELQNELEIAKLQAEGLNKNNINSLRQYASSREFANSGNSRGRGSRPWA